MIMTHYGNKCNINQQTEQNYNSRENMGSSINNKNNPQQLNI